MSSKQLTDTAIRGLKPKAKVYRIADTNGLTLEVRPTGAKFWRYRYRFAGKANMLALGQYPSMSLQQARKERDRLRGLLQAGSNPSQVAKAERAAAVVYAGTTFRAVAHELLDKRQREGLSEGSLKRERRLIDKDLALIADLPVSEVTAQALLAALRRIEGAGIIETAHRARSLAGRVFRFAMITGRASHNPAGDLVGALQQSKTRHLASITDPSRIGELLRAIHGYTGSPVTQAALRLAPLTFVRPGELRKARWVDIDLEAGEWRFTASKTKTAHIVPLSRQAVELLSELKPYTKRSEFVFPGVRSAARPMSENTINAALRNLGYDGSTMTGHGFRAMARTVLDEVLGFRPDFIEHQLAHSVRDPLGRAYNRATHLPERRRMMQAWADYLDGLREQRLPAAPESSSQSKVSVLQSRGSK